MTRVPREEGRTNRGPYTLVVLGLVPGIVLGLALGLAPGLAPGSAPGAADPGEPSATPRTDLTEGGLPSGMSQSEAEELVVREMLEHGSPIVEEIIGVKPVLGGTMGFHARENIHVLNDRWVFAWFEDGHIGGEVLLHFQIMEDRSIRWDMIRVVLY